MKGPLLLTFFFARWRVSIKRDTSDVDWLLFSEKTTWSSPWPKFFGGSSSWCFSLTFLRACIVPTTICVSGIWAGSKKITRYLCTRRRKKDKKLTLPLTQGVKLLWPLSKIPNKMRDAFLNLCIKGKSRA